MSQNQRRKARGRAEAGRQELTGVLPFLFAVRWGAWAIALVLVLFGDLPHENTRYEPLVLGLTFAQTLAATLYVPVMRPYVRRAMSDRWRPDDDLVALGLVDVALVMAVLFLSGGWFSPYQHYAVTSLLVPAFLLDRWRAGLLLLGFFAAYLVVISTAGEGTGGPWLHEDASSLAGILITPLLVVIVVQYLSHLAGRLGDQRERAESALAENLRLQEEREQLVAQEERSRIAREIHDGIAQSVYMLTLNLEKAAEVASVDRRLADRLGRLVGLAKETLLEVRHYIFDLKPLLAGDAGLSAAIRNQAQEFSAVSGLPVEVRVDGRERKVPLVVGSSLYRIAQEALANVYRHADASSINVRLAYRNGSVCLEVRDDGLGFSVETSTNGRGLRNMRQRADELGGSMEIESSPGNGASMRVTVPIPAEARA